LQDTLNRMERDKCKKRFPFVRFYVFMAVTMKNAAFWDVRPRSSCKSRRFLGTYRLHHQGDKNRRTSNWSTLRRNTMQHFPP
jgi:hypothetical protein